jgi:hypothetical protein
MRKAALPDLGKGRGTMNSCSLPIRIDLTICVQNRNTRMGKCNYGHLMGLIPCKRGQCAQAHEIRAGIDFASEKEAHAAAIFVTVRDRNPSVWQPSDNRIIGLGSVGEYFRGIPAHFVYACASKHKESLVALRDVAEDESNTSFLKHDHVNIRDLSGGFTVFLELI